MNLAVLMRTGTLIASLFIVGMSVALSQPPPPDPTKPTLTDYCRRFQRLYIAIREQSVTPDAARQSFRGIMLGLRARFYSPVITTDTLYLNRSQPVQPQPDVTAPMPDSLAQVADSLVQIPDSVMQNMQAFRVADSLQTPDSVVIITQKIKPVAPRIGAFVFPIRGYGPAAVGGADGDGYRGKGFDLFDYTVRGSHPAQDIFIDDENQDHLDDHTNRPVDVLAMRAGLVLAIETGWQPGSDYRGGNWIWIYDPVLNGLWYYAHNHVVKVKQGQWVAAGQKISEMGRTGFNAYQPRSPTHLHLMYLKIQPNGMPIPNNTYRWLLTAKRR